MRALGKPDLVTFAHFEPSYHVPLGAAAPAALATELPRIQIHKPIPPGVSLIFAAGDHLYLQTYGWPMIASLARHAEPDTILALHVFDCTADETAALMSRIERIKGITIALSTEWTGLRDAAGPNRPTPEAKAYYHAVRFLRLFEICEQHANLTAWMIDMDMLFNRSPRNLIPLTGYDLALWLTPGRFEVNNQIMGGVVGVAPTPVGRDFLRQVAGYIATIKRERGLPWGIDQLALYVVLVDLINRGIAPRIAPVTPELCGVGFAPEATLWPGKIDPTDKDYPRVVALLEQLEADAAA